MKNRSIYRRNIKSFVSVDGVNSVWPVSLLIIASFLFSCAPTGSSIKAYPACIKADFKVMEDAIMLFERDTGRYPASWEELLEGKDIQGWQGPYLKKLPLDPWERPYLLNITGDSEKPLEIKTLGADNKPGGESEAKDYSSLEFQKGRD
jgi:general secretion pathway protein G